MREFDVDLIMALAEGTLPADEARRLEASLTPEAAAELAAQRLALQALQAAPAPSLTAAERIRLHDAVLDRVAPAPAPRPRRRFRWRAAPSLAAAAVAAVAVVASVGLVGRGLLGGDDDGADVVAGATSTLPAAESAPTAPIFEDAQTAESADEFLAEPGVGEILADDAARLGAGPAITEDDLDGLRADVGRYSGPTTLAPADQPCYEDAVQVASGEIEFAGFATLDGQPVVLFFAEPGDEVGPAAYAFATAGCELLAGRGG